MDMNLKGYKFIFDEILSKSDDGFIVVDKNGIIIEINQLYCDFLGRSREKVIGQHISKIIRNTSMIDVLNSGHRGDKDYVHKYHEDDVRDKNDRFSISNRFCVFDENNQIIAAVAQMKFTSQTLDFAGRVIREQGELELYKEHYNSSIAQSYSMDRIIGDNKEFLNVKRLALKAAKTVFPVLITGETGTGKEVLANAIHNDSKRSGKPMVSINCAAIPSELLESELFGYEEGAFTGAKKGGKKGKFQLADGGTIFLDEIGDMPLNMQAKLLRVLQEKEVERIGSYSPVPVDIRVLAATRKNLPEMIDAGEFREDLFYRLSVINIEMPPLRKRRDDILTFANYFLNKLNIQYKTAIVFSKDVKHCFANYSWPGNIRELDNVIKSAYASCENYIIQLTDLPSKMVSKHRANTIMKSEGEALSQIIDDFEASVIKETLKNNNWNCKIAAQELGINRSLIYKKMKRLGIKIKKTI